MNTNKQSSKIKYIPNILTIIRIFLSVICVTILCTTTKWNNNFYVIHFSSEIETHIEYTCFISGIIFCVASFTDFLDGYLARKYNIVSDFGKLFDPIADKILVNGVLIVFAVLSVIPLWIPIIMITRDIIVDAARMYALKKNIVVAANIWGKLKTILQISGLIVIFFIFNFYSCNHIWYYLVQNLLLIFATIFSVVSGIIYLVNIFSNKRYEKDKNQ